MTTIKVKFRPSSAPDREGAIYYQVFHDRKKRQFFSGYNVFSYEWNERRATVKITPGEREEYLKSIRESIKHDLTRFKRILRKMENDNDELTVDELITQFIDHTKENTLFNYMERIIARLKKNGNFRTSEIYRTTLNSFKKYRRDEDVPLDSIDSEMIEDFAAWHKNRGNIPNTISFYCRVLRAVYNRAVEEGIIDDCHPFRRVFTGVDKTIKRAIPISLIRTMKRLPLIPGSGMEFARDIFLLSFYLRGMSFVDMAFVKKSDLFKHYLTYRRRKTGQKLVIEWTQDMQRILDKYPKLDTPYLFPIMKRENMNHPTAYRNTLYRINKNLKKIGIMIGTDWPLTLYVARHSWASAAKTKGVPISVISEGMGHNSETTTKIYLASLERSVVDKANSMIIRSVR